MSYVFRVSHLYRRRLNRRPSLNLFLRRSRRRGHRWPPWRGEHGARCRRRSRGTEVRYLSRCPALLSARAGERLAGGVVFSALLFVGENSVRLAHLFEFLFVAAFLIRMILVSQFSERGLDVVLAGRLRNSQDVVIVFHIGATLY